MRKPLAVVLGVTAAVLIAGGIAATTAGADTAPDEPPAPALNLPAMPELPQVPGHDAPALPDLPDAAAGDQPDADQQDARGGQSADQQNPRGGQPADQQDPRGGGPADQQDPRGGQPALGQSVDQPDRDRPAGDRPVPGAPAQRPGGAAGAAGPDAADRPAAGGQASKSLVAAAQQDVTPSSVSTNPSAPVQQQVLALVNANRRRGGCGDLTLDRRLIAAAYDHADDMARRGYFAHESPNGDGSGDRMREAGYDWSRYGENIARGQESVYEVVDGWMHSPVHRENIMDCRLRQMGIGLAFARDRTPYWVQDFATPQ